MFIHLCFRAVVRVCRYNFVQSCPCVCTIVQSHTLVPLGMHHCTTAYPCALVHAQLHTLMQSCACTLVLAPLRNRVPLFSRALVRLCLHNYTQLCNDAFVLSCFRACTHAYIHAVVRLCGCTVAHSCACAKVAGKARLRRDPCRTCLYDGHAQQNLTHLLSLSHLSRASRSRETNSSWLMPKFVQMQSMSSPSSRRQVATCSTTRSKSSLSTWNSSGMASPEPSVRKSMLHSKTMLKRRRK